MGSFKIAEWGDNPWGEFLWGGASPIYDITRMDQRGLIINLDFCDLTYGVGDCTAVDANKCYKTLSTSRDAPNFINTVGKDYKISMSKKPYPFPGEIWYPYLIKEPKYRATEIDPAKSLTKRARMKYVFANPNNNDIGIDPHASDRATYPNDIGPFWDLLWARNQYYMGRKVTDIRGFHGQLQSEYVTNRFKIDQVKFNKDGTCIMICKDLLELAVNATVPFATDGITASDPVTAGAENITMSTGTDMTQYDASGFFHAGNEGQNIIEYKEIDGQVFKRCSWSKFNTSQVDIEQGTKIQQCYVKENIMVTDIMIDIIENYMDFDETIIDKAEFRREQLNLLPEYIFTVVWTKPIRAEIRLSNLQEQSSSNIWWDEVKENVRFKAFAPSAGTGYETLTETDIISIVPLYNEQSRISRTLVYYDVIDWTADLKDPNNYRALYGDISTTSEGTDQYGSKAIKEIFAYGVTTINIATALGSNYEARFVDPPRKYKIVVERKDADIEVAQILILEHRRNINPDGSQVTDQYFQVLRQQYLSPGRLELIVMDTKW